MAKKNRKATDEALVTEKKSIGFFQVLLLWVVIPLLFGSAVLLVILKVADINLFEKMNEWKEHLPFSSSSEKSEEASVDFQFEEKVVELEAEIKEKEAKLSELQTALDTAQQEKEELLIEQQSLMAEIETLKLERANQDEEKKDLIATFENMSDKAAAPILINMKDAEVLDILKSLKPEKAASILEKMPPEKASKYASLLAK